MGARNPEKAATRAAPTRARDYPELMFMGGSPHARRSCQAVPQPISGTAKSAAIAQLVEHIIRNDGVGGSNPSCGTTTVSSRHTVASFPGSAV